MKKRVIQFLTLCLVTTFTFSFSVGQTQPGIHLGRLEFVRPPEGLSNDMRGLMETMSKTKGITSSFAHKVGGVSFVQVAQPTFHVESFSLQCDLDNNSAYATINGQRYNIPLETWQLMPITAYANSEYDAAVSLFGELLYQNQNNTDTISIFFHNAFIDKLLGIRLLHIDLLFSDILQYEDRGKLPTFDNSTSPILSKSEALMYNPDKLLSLSSLASDSIDIIIDDYLEESNYSYVFTDAINDFTGSPITFNIINNSLKIEGHPYYYFIHFDETRFDTLETLCDFFDEYDEIVDAFEEIINPKTSNILNFQNYKSLSEKVKINNHNGAIAEFRERYNHIPDSTTASAIFQTKRNNLKRFISIYKKDNPSEYHQLQKEFEPLYDLTEKILIDEDNIREVIRLSMIWTLFIEADTNLTNTFPTFDDFLICYFYQYPNYQMKELTKLTNAIRKKRDLVRNLNPIVYDAAVATCQWSAFFRYAKENYPQNWNSFVKQVEKLQYDAPKVYTPIKVKNR